MESNETPETTETTQTENSTETTTETVEQPTEESTPDVRFSFLEKDEKPETKDEAKPEEQVKEQPKKEKKVTFSDDLIEIEDDGKVEKLVAFKLDDKIVGYIPESLKADNGFLRQADYSKKTQELKTREQELTEKEQGLTELQKEAYLLSIAGEAGKPKKKPLLDVMGDLRKPDGNAYENGEPFIGKDGKLTGAIVYTNAQDHLEADTQHQEWEQSVRGIVNTQSSVREQNLKTLDAFTKEVGEDRAKEVFAEASKYVNKNVFSELAPYPIDALKLIDKGMRYDADIEKRVNDAVLKKVKELEGKQTTKTNTPQVTATDDVRINVPNRYQFMNK